MTKKQFEKNVEYLNKHNIEVVNTNLWEGQPFSAELENYTNGGGDMLIELDVLDKEHLQEYIHGFNINEEVLGWWHNGQKGNGVPYDNIKEHYEDVEDWLNNLYMVSNGMPY